MRLISFLKPVLVRAAVPSASRHCGWAVQTGPPRMALYSLTERANFPFRAEPAKGDVIWVHGRTSVQNLLGEVNMAHKRRLCFAKTRGRCRQSDHGNPIAFLSLVTLA